MELENLTAVILAGGLGTRLRPLVSDRPKVMAPVAGSPFLEIVLQRLGTFGVASAVICTGYLAEQVSSSLGQSMFGVTIRYSVETSPLGTAGAIAQALSLHHAEDPILAMNGDSFCSADLRQFAKQYSSHRCEGLLLLVPIADASRYGRVSTDSENRIVSFEEKGKPGPGLISAGVYLLSRTLIEEIPLARRSSLENEFFPRWAREQRLIGSIAEGAEFVDIGTPESYQRAQTLFEV